MFSLYPFLLLVSPYSSSSEKSTNRLWPLIATCRSYPGPDDHPILGPVPSLERFILTCGWGGTGIIQAPIAGQLVAECIGDGHATTLDIGPLGINRFEKTYGKQEKGRQGCSW